MMRLRSSACASAPVATVLAVAEDRVALGDGLHLFEEVADVDDRDPLRLQPADHLEQPRGVVLGERAGRLVEDDHPGLGDQAPGDLDELPRRRG